MKAVAKTISLKKSYIFLPFSSGLNSLWSSANMSSQRGRWRPPKKVNSSPGLSSAYDETATLLERANSTSTVHK